MLGFSLATAGFVSPAPTLTKMVLVRPSSESTNFTVCAPGLTDTWMRGVLPSDLPSRMQVEGGIELMLRKASPPPPPPVSPPPDGDWAWGAGRGAETGAW